MVHQNDYPSIEETHRDTFNFLLNLHEYSDLEEHLDNGFIRIAAFEKSFWGRKKALELTIVKIIDADEATKTFDENSNGNIFGVIVIQRSKEICRALYDTGVLLGTATLISDFYRDEIENHPITSPIDRKMLGICVNKFTAIGKVIKLHTSIEALFNHE